MFGIGLYNAYGQFSIAGINGALLVALFTRLLVGIGWYRLFDKAGKNPIHAFVPFLGPYVAFRLAWDDFSFAAIRDFTVIDPIRPVAPVTSTDESAKGKNSSLSLIIF